uniref:Putative group iv salivary lipocalin n=1 Tax=Rhipicephalus microplus TaxID=6941 RepID=A0A6G5A7E6_RHIMP
MEPYNIWIFLLIAMVTPQHLSAQKKVSRPASKNVPQKSLPYLFMLTNPMYLHLTTRGIPGVACIKAIRTRMNPTARTLSQVLVFKSSRKWSYDYEYVDYTPIWKNNKKVRGFTSFNKSTGEKTTYTLHHIYKDCAIVNKTKNTKRGGYKQVCEVWVNDQFFDRNTDGLKFCTANFWKYCKPHTPNNTLFPSVTKELAKLF